MTKPRELTIEDEKIIESQHYKEWRLKVYEDAVNTFFRMSKTLGDLKPGWLESAIRENDLEYYKEWVLPHKEKEPGNEEMRFERSITMSCGNAQVYELNNLTHFSDLPAKGEIIRVGCKDYEVVSIKTSIYEYPALNIEQIIKSVELEEMKCTGNLPNTIRTITFRPGEEAVVRTEMKHE